MYASGECKIIILRVRDWVQVILFSTIVVIVSYSRTVALMEICIFIFLLESGSLEKFIKLEKVKKILITFRSGHLMYKIVFNDLMTFDVY